MKRPSLAAWFALSLGAASAASAGDLRGTLQGLESLRSAPAPEVPERRLYFWMQSNGALATREPRPNPERDLAVVITGGTVPEAAQPVNLTVAGGGCQPGTVVVSPGTTLMVRNIDWFAHELYATTADGDAPVEGFGPETTAPNSQRSGQLRAAGRYVLRDRLNPLFRCWIIAGPGQGRVMSPAADGSFRTSNLADGDYTLKVYLDGREIATAPARVAGREVVVPPINLAAAPPAEAANASPAANSAGNSQANTDPSAANGGRANRRRRR